MLAIIGLLPGLLPVNAAMFFIGVTTLAMGGWQVALRRVPEAISSVVPILGIICFLILMTIVWGGHDDIYHWINKETVAGDKLLNGKKGFLNPVFFSVFSAITIFLWWFLGHKLRALSLESDKTGPMDYETGKKWINKYSLGSFIHCIFWLIGRLNYSMVMVNEY